jgi:hypothetical protein
MTNPRFPTSFELILRAEMMTNRIWCAAPGSVDAAGKKSSGMQEAQTSS